MIGGYMWAGNRSPGYARGGRYIGTKGGDVTLTYARVPLSSNYASFQRLKQELTSIIKQATYYRVRFTT